MCYCMHLGYRGRSIPEINFIIKKGIYICVLNKKVLKKTMTLDYVSKKTKFSLRHRRVLFTFKTHIPKSQLLELFNSVLPVRYHTICHETGDTNPQEKDYNPYPHTHALVCFFAQPNIKDPRRFDHGSIHPHIKRIYDDQHYNNAHHYCFKEDQQVHTNYYDDGSSHSVKVQIEKICGKRKLKDVFFDEDTMGIAKSRCYWSKTIFNYSRPRRLQRTKLHVYYGPSFTGKTTTAMSQYPDADVILIRNDFVMGYHHGRVCIINEFDPLKVPVLELLKLVDSGPCTIQVKGGETEWAPELLVITTKYHPSHWYPLNPERWPDILNRIDLCLKFKKNPNFPIGGSLNDKDPLSPESCVTFMQE